MSGTGDLHLDAALDEWREGRRPDPRPRRRTRAPDAGRAKCLSIDARCRVCGGARGLQRHHVVPRSQGGDDVDENLVPLCSDCHRRITGNDRLALRLLRERLMPEEEAYVVSKRGEDWLDRRYPRESRS